MVSPPPENPDTKGGKCDARGNPKPPLKVLKIPSELHFHAYFGTHFLLNVLFLPK